MNAKNTVVDVDVFWADKQAWGVGGLCYIPTQYNRRSLPISFRIHFMPEVQISTIKGSTDTLGKHQVITLNPEPFF